ncbi:unnamed protein product [Rangifer tarandus platyrhynchus]|uniref:Uncharacterized protein n=1 Tax=Rangifer tarandus platyrhynchus TaxID=3082113 RepID=A0ABN8XUY0_RANTA|nr:unnamed protein product [Rangifer tarandus platyrhynchus]
MGLSEKEGLDMDDIPYILEGHFPDRYQFNSLKLMPKGIGNHTGCPLLEDRVHCVAFVFNANSVEQLSYQMVKKIKRIRRELIKSEKHVCMVSHSVMSNSLQPMNCSSCSSSGFSVRRVLKERTLEWFVISSSRGSP